MKKFKQIFNNKFYIIISTLILFLGFYSNFWNVADSEWFEKQNFNMESFIIGRIVKSNQDGILSYGGLTGIGGSNYIQPEFNTKTFEFQWSAYYNELSFETFLPYYSQIGGQGIFFSLLDQIIPFSPQTKYNFFIALTSLFTAISISLVILWFYYEFNLLVSITVLFSTVLSPWLVVFGGKLWWSTWSFFLPMVVVMYYLRNKNFRSINLKTFGCLILFSVLVKCVFTGYEYITTTLVMMMVPYIYYSVLNRYKLDQFIFGFIISIGFALIAILMSFVILSFQISMIKGSLLDGINHLVNSFEKRSYGDPNDFSPIYSPSLNSNIFSVVFTYLEGSLFGLNKYSNPIISNLIKKINFLFLIILFLIMTGTLLLIGKNCSFEKIQRVNIALISSLWFSILAPLSWFVLFKAHSFIHTHMNFIVWHMPFTFFGFSICGRVIDLIITDKILSRKDKKLSKMNTFPPIGFNL